MGCATKTQGLIANIQVPKWKTRRLELRLIINCFALVPCVELLTNILEVSGSILCVQRGHSKCLKLREKGWRRRKFVYEILIDNRNRRKKDIFIVVSHRLRGASHHLKHLRKQKSLFHVVERLFFTSTRNVFSGEFFFDFSLPSLIPRTSPASPPYQGCESI